MSFTFGRRDLYLVAGAKAVSLLGDEMAAIAVVLRLQAHGAGPLGIAALLMANLLPMLLLSGVVGRLVDRADARSLLVLSSLAQTAVCLVLVFSTAVPAVLVLMCLLGAGQAVNGATWQTLLPAIAKGDALPRAIALTQMATTTAGIAAPALSGVLTGTYGPRVPLLIDAATFLAVTLAAVLLRVATAPPAAGDRAGSSAGGFAIVRADALLRPLFLLLGLFVLLGSMVNVVDVFLVREVLHASATWYGLSGAALSLGMLAGAVLGGRITGVSRHARWFVGACVLLALGLAAMGGTPSVLVLLPIGFATGVGNGLVNVTLGAMVMGRAVASERGRVSAMLGGTVAAAQLSAFVTGGLLAEALGARGVFVLAGCLGLLAPLLLGRSLLHAADSTLCPTPTSLPSAGESSPPAALPTPSLAI